MAGKRKMTGFARLLLALIIIVPGAYIGASYMSGEDGIENVKKIIGLENAANSTEKKESSKNVAEGSACELQINSFKKQVKNLRYENEKLREEIEILKNNR